MLHRHGKHTPRKKISGGSVAFATASEASEDPQCRLNLEAPPESSHATARHFILKFCNPSLSLSPKSLDSEYRGLNYQKNV